jgi:hypothetical protein
MSRRLFLWLSSFCLICSANAQDIILKVNGDEIQSRVAEIGLDEVKYHRFDNLTGPVYSIKKSEIFMITYEDGTKDIFGKQQQSQTKTVTAPAPVTAPVRVQQPAAEQTVSLSEAKQGDIVDINGQKAIVFQTYGNGHGKAMAVKAFRGEEKVWCKKNSYAGKIKTLDIENGQANTEAVFGFVQEKGLDINDFPVFAWCKSLGAGWYIPSVAELEHFVKFWMGNATELDWDDEEVDSTPVQSTNNSGRNTTYGQNEHTKKINKTIVDAGGIPFSNATFSSTERNGKILVFEYKVYKSDMPWEFNGISKNDLGVKHTGRAFFNY